MRGDTGTDKKTSADFQQMPYIKLPLQGHLVLNFSIFFSYLHTDEEARIRRNMVYQIWL